MPRAFSEQEKIQIRQRLIEHGARLFSTVGLKKTSVEELAVASGISKAAFYLFYPSKEALFMDVAEQAERQYRKEVLAAIDLDGPTPRARLVGVIRRAFRLWKTIPVLQFFTSADFNQVSARVPEEQVLEHMRSDQQFVVELVERCQAASIPIQASPAEIGGLFYTLFFSILHVDDMGPGNLDAAMDLLVELVAAYCLGEVAVGQNRMDPALKMHGTARNTNELSD